MSEYLEERISQPIVHKWHPVLRGSAMRDAIYIGIRKNSIIFSAGFTRKAKFSENGYTHVQVFSDALSRSISFRFLTDDEADKMATYMGPITNIYLLGNDGGGKKRLNDAKVRASRMIQCNRLFKVCPWATSMKTEVDAKSVHRADIHTSEHLGAPRHCIPVYDRAEDRWKIDIIPGFMHRREASFIELPSDSLGLYRYVSATGEILYVGQGRLAQRHRSHAIEKDIPATYFDYSIVPSLEMRETAETFWIRAFLAEHGRLPRYNKNQGNGDAWVGLKTSQGMQRP